MGSCGWQILYNCHVLHIRFKRDYFCVTVCWDLSDAAWRSNMSTGRLATPFMGKHQHLWILLSTVAVLLILQLSMSFLLAPLYSVPLWKDFDLYNCFNRRQIWNPCYLLTWLFLAKSKVKILCILSSSRCRLKARSVICLYFTKSFTP